MAELSPHDPDRQHKQRRRKGGARVGRRLHGRISFGVFIPFVS